MVSINRNRVLSAAAVLHFLGLALSTSAYTPHPPHHHAWGRPPSAASSSPEPPLHHPPPPYPYPYPRPPHPSSMMLESRLGDVMDDELGPADDDFGDVNMMDDLELGDDVEYSDEELLAMAGDWDETVPQFNTIHLSGRIGGDPEPRYFDDGKCVVNLRLAVTRKYHSLERKASNIKYGDEETDWYRLEIWGQTAEFVSKFVDKGMRVGVIGSLEVNQWEDRETGEMRSAPRVIVRDFNILETRAESEGRREGRRGRSFYKGGSSSNNNDDDYYGGPVSAGSGSGFF